MNNILFGLLVGFGSAIIVFPIGLWIYTLFRNANERRAIKRLMKQGKILEPLDPKDYDVKAWQNQKYGNINSENNKQLLEKLNDKIFHKNIETIDDNFMLKISEYVQHARKQGFKDEQIKAEFKKKSYSEELINKIFEENGK